MNSNLHSNDAAIGMNLAQQGRYAEALPYLDRANRAAPADVPLLHAAASLLQSAGKLDDAVSRYRTAAQSLPGDSGVLLGWARALLLAGDEDAAIGALDQALQRDPGIAASDGQLLMLWNTDDRDTAARILRALVARHPDNADLLCQLAQMLRTAEYLDEARSAWQAYMALRPDDPLGPVEAGRLAVGRGDVEAAREFFNAALRIVPDNASALSELAHLQRGSLDVNVLDRLLALDATPDVEGASLISDALARHFARIEDYPRAAGHVARMNALQEAELPLAQRYDLARHVDEVSFAMDAYSPQLLARVGQLGNRDRRPVFVLGLPRSGTTLLERMLASHPSIVGVGEQSFARQSLLRALAAGDGLPQSLTAAPIATSGAWHLQLLEERLHRLGLPADAERIVDKLPDNYLLAGWIRIVFPNAIIVHSLRDPRDVAWSCWSTQFVKINWSMQLEHIAHRIEQHRRLMRHWRATLGDRLIELRYERLVANPETEIRRVLDAVGLDWHPDVMTFADRKGYVGSASRHQVRESLHSRGIGRWRHYEDALRPILPRLEAIVATDAIEATPELKL